jgi:hypothetical protein
MVAGAIEPGLVVEAGDVITSVSPSHLPTDWPIHESAAAARILHIDVAHGARVLVRDEDVVLALEDLERIRHVVGARHAGQIALDLGIGSQPVLLVVLLLLERAGRYGIVSPSTMPRPAGTEPTAPIFTISGAGTGTNWPGTIASAPRGMRLEIEIRGVQRLPDAVQVGLAVLGARPLAGCGSCQCAGRENCRAVTSSAREMTRIVCVSPRSGDKTMSPDRLSIRRTV